MSLPCGRDAWTGGFCELAIQLGPLNDAHLQQGLRARAAREGERFTGGGWWPDRCTSGWLGQVPKLDSHLSRLPMLPLRGLAVAQVGSVMDLPAKPPARAAAAQAPLELAKIRRSPRRRRPSGQPPPLPRHLQISGVGWLAAAVVLLVLSVVVFAGGLRGPAVAVTVADDAVVRWLAGLRVPGLLPAMRALAVLGSWVAISALLYGLLAALLILRRLRQLLIVLAAWIMQGVIIQYIVAPLAQRPRPFGVVFRTGWDAWALPSEKMAALVVTLLGILYALVPEGRWRQRGKWAAAAVVLLVALARLYFEVLATTDVLVGVAVGVAIPLVGFRLFAPGEVFPVTYRRG